MTGIFNFARTCALCVVTFGFISLFSSGRATTVVPPDFASMVKRAEVIFRGQVTGVKSEWTGEGSDRHIETYVTFEVARAIKGSPSSPYTLQFLGGTVGNQTLEVDDVPKFAVGDITLLFVEHNGTQFAPLVGIMYGYYKIESDAKSGQPSVIKFDGHPLHGTAELDQMHQMAVASAGVQSAAATTASGPAMKLSDFETKIQANLAAGH